MWHYPLATVPCMWHTVYMRLKLNRALVLMWKESVGGLDPATVMIKKCLSCSLSKADKIAAGRYPSTPTPLERKALAKLMKVEETELFVPVEGTKSRAS